MQAVLSLSHLLAITIKQINIRVIAFVYLECKQICQANQINRAGINTLFIIRLAQNYLPCLFVLMSDSMLRTLHSDTKINILNPNLDVKMFIKGVQTYLESIFSVPFVPNKKMLWLALKTLKV